MFFGPFRGQIFKFENETLSIGIDGFYFEYRNTLKKERSHQMKPERKTTWQ